MPNCCQQQYPSAISLISDGFSTRRCANANAERRFFWATVSPILLTVLCLTTTCATNAQESLKNTKPIPRLTSQSPAPPLTGVVSSGNQISLNGRTLPGTWLQRPGKSGQVTTHLSDGVFRQLIGVNFLNSSNSAKQPIQWFSSVTTPLVLATRLLGAYRYLDITNFAQTSGWQIQTNGNILMIATPKAQITNIVQSQEPPSASAPLQQARILVNLDYPTPWQVAQGSAVKKIQPPSSDQDTPTPKSTTPPNREWTVTLDGIADPVLIERYTPQPPAPTVAPPILLPNLLKQLSPATPTQPILPAPAPAPEPLIQQVEVVKNQTIISLSVPFGLSPQVSTVGSPNRLIIDIRPDPLEERDITWAPGLRWRQHYVNLGTERFPVVWLEVNPRKFGLTLKPMWASPDGLAGTAPLIQTAQRYLAVAGINGGYFNRNNRLPLGAIRRDSQWLSGPILNRGAIAWNDSGQFYFGRLTLEETLITANNQRLPILFLNSGYIQSGIARYTPVWGSTYTPLTDNEIILVVQKDQITNQLPGGKVGGTVVPIPQDGYLLTLRANAVTAASQLPIGSAVSISSATAPADFSRYPYIIGAGPLLVQNRQIVLDAKAEKFSNAFIAEKAIRSGICTTATGTLMITAVHNRVGGYGPNLAEHAQLMQLMGCVDALNLDGGSSTSLYLGGQLLDRSPSTAARVHNGIGIFLKPR
ncbi:MAG: phosphodiester glycosidase family protein [Nostoc sp.]